MQLVYVGQCISCPQIHIHNMGKMEILNATLVYCYCNFVLGWDWWPPYWLWWKLHWHELLLLLLFSVLT